MHKFKIIWADQAKAELKRIYDFYKEKHPKEQRMYGLIYYKALKQYIFQNSTR